MQVTVAQLRQTIRSILREALGLDEAPPEYSSVDAFVEYCWDQGVNEFSAQDLQQLNRWTQQPIQKIRAELESWQLKLANRPVEKKPRGFLSHDATGYSGAKRSLSSGEQQHRRHAQRMANTTKYR